MLFVCMSAGPCDVLGTAVELFGEMRSVPEVATLQAQALAGAAASAVAVLQVRACLHLLTCEAGWESVAVVALRKKMAAAGNIRLGCWLHYHRQKVVQDLC